MVPFCVVFVQKNSKFLIFRKGIFRNLNLRRLWNDPTIIVENKPTFLSGIMQGSGNKPPGVVPDKMKYMMYDMQRLNKFTQIPIHPISDPFTTLFKKDSSNAY